MKNGSNNNNNNKNNEQDFPKSLERINQQTLTNCYVNTRRV